MVPGLAGGFERDLHSHLALLLEYSTGTSGQEAPFYMHGSCEEGN